MNTTTTRASLLTSAFLSCFALGACGGGGADPAATPSPGGGAGANVSSRCASYANLPGHTVVMTDADGVTTWTANTAASFEGHSAIEIAQNTQLTLGGTSVIKAYGSFDPATHLLTGYGNTSHNEATFAGKVNGQDAKVVVSPPVVSSQFALSAGQSVTETWAETTTSVVTTNGVVGAPKTSSKTRVFTITFSGIEVLSTPAGKFNVCKFVSTLAGSTLNQIDYVLADSGIGITATTASITVDGKVLSGL